MLEMLVAIAILSLITTLIYNAFFSASTSTRKVTQALSTRQELRLLMKIVLDDLQSVQYLANYVTQNSDNNYYHSGIFSKRIPGPESQRVNFIHFHAAIPTRFFPKALELQKDPELHELSYFLEFDQTEQAWAFKRREDFYIDSDISEGGREQLLSTAVTFFELEFLEQSIRATDSNELQDVWVPEWDSQENQCRVTSRASGNTPCLPLAIRVTLHLKSEDGSEAKDTLEINLPVSLQQ